MTTPAVGPEGNILFDYTLWSARFPALAPSITAPTASLLWDEAGQYCNNTTGSPVPDLTRRQVILNLITAHLAILNWPTVANGGEAPSLVGRITNASEGGVSVAANMGGPESADWWNQTQPGSQAYQLLRKAALTWYFPGPRPVFDPVGLGPFVPVLPAS